MKQLLIVTLFIFNSTFCILHSAFAQDIHFSQFNASPLTLNPAMTGLIKKDYRIIGNYKSQWSSLETSGSQPTYSTFSASYDMNIHEFGKKQVMGAGIIFFNDKAGDSQLSTSLYELSWSYSLLFGKKTIQYVVFGLQSGIIQRSINYSKLEFPNQVDPNTKKFNADLSTGLNAPADNQFMGDISTGFLWYVSRGKSSLYFGAASYHINKPNQSFLRSEDRLYQKNVFHGGCQIPLNKKLDLSPSFLFLRQGPHGEIDLGTFLRYRLSERKNEIMAASFGSWLRLKDAFILVGRLEYGSYTVALSYDVNVSSLIKASQLRAGPEVSVIYLGSFTPKWKKVSRNKRMFCPDF